jgi:DNA-binding HxlR family transcriptional regulator
MINNKTRIGVNWWLRQKLRIEELEHLVDDLRIHNRVLKSKLKKLENRKT